MEFTKSQLVMRGIDIDIENFIPKYLRLFTTPVLSSDGYNAFSIYNDDINMQVHLRYLKSGKIYFVIRTVELDSDIQGKGVFTKLLLKLEKLVEEFEYGGMGFETVMEDRFGEFLERKGYTNTGADYGITHIKDFQKKINYVVEEN